MVQDSKFPTDTVAFLGHNQRAIKLHNAAQVTMLVLLSVITFFHIDFTLFLSPSVLFVYLYSVCLGLDENSVGKKLIYLELFASSLEVLQRHHKKVVNIPKIATCILSCAQRPTVAQMHQGQRS